MNTADPLAQLRDIHLPEPVSWWPPAPGWWILTFLGTAFLFFGFRFLYRYWRQNRYRRVAFRELEHLEQNPPDNPQILLENLSILLRRVSLQAYGREKVSPLSGEQWLAFLDSTGGTDRFSTGPAKILGHGLYQQKQEFDAGPIIQDVRQWIKGHKK